MINVNDLGDVVNDLRMKEGMTLDEVSHEIGVSKNTISRIERGLGCHSHTYCKLVQWVEKHETA